MYQIGKFYPEKAKYKNAEEYLELAYLGALRTHATILTHGPLFGDFVYGGLMEKQEHAINVVPRDGLRGRFHIIRGDQRLHMILERDGYATEEPIRVSNDLAHITFTLENRAERAHESRLILAGLPAGDYAVQIGQRTLAPIHRCPAEQTILLPLESEPKIRVFITKAP